MIRIIFFTMILLSLILVPLVSSAQNPFTSRKDPPKLSASPAPSNKFLTKIAAWQQKLNSKMAALIRESKKTGSMRPLLILMIISFVYGIIHSAGPGHGKAVALSYILYHRGKPVTGVLFGNLIAISHGLSGAVLVLALHYLIQRNVMGTMEYVEHTTRIISYSLIALLGSVMLIGKSYRLSKNIISNKKISSDKFDEKQKKGTFALSLAIGMVPCPGVVFVMLFALSLKMTSLGIMLALSLTLGMAITISTVVLIGLAGKNIVIGSFKKQRRFVKIAENIIEISAAAIITTLGLVFLAATIRA